MSCASAALRKDVLDSKAWELMANAQKLRSAREAALARAVERLLLSAQLLRPRLFSWGKRRGVGMRACTVVLM